MWPGEDGKRTEALLPEILVLWVRPSRAAHAGPTPLGAEIRTPRALGAELDLCAHRRTMNRCPRRFRSPLGQAARSLYQLVTGSLSPGMRKGGKGWTPSKSKRSGIGALQRWGEKGPLTEMEGAGSFKEKSLKGKTPTEVELGIGSLKKKVKDIGVFKEERRRGIIVPHNGGRGGRAPY